MSEFILFIFDKISSFFLLLNDFEIFENISLFKLIIIIFIIRLIFIFLKGGKK